MSYSKVECAKSISYARGNTDGELTKEKYKKADTDVPLEEVIDEYGSWEAVIELSKAQEKERLPDTRKSAQGVFDDDKSIRVDKSGYFTIPTGGVEELPVIGVHRIVALNDNSLKDVIENEVHHKNHCPYDNRPENLEPLSKHEHRVYHGRTSSPK